MRISDWSSDVCSSDLHLHEGDKVTDRYADDATSTRWQQARMDVDGHGTGCTLASAIAANLCLGRTPVDACAAAIGYVHDALVRGYAPGCGAVLVLDHFGARRPRWVRRWWVRRRRVASRHTKTLLPRQTHP